MPFKGHPTRSQISPHVPYSPAGTALKPSKFGLSGSSKMYSPSVLHVYSYPTPGVGVPPPSPYTGSPKSFPPKSGLLHPEGSTPPEAPLSMISTSVPSGHVIHIVKSPMNECSMIAEKDMRSSQSSSTWSGSKKSMNNSEVKGIPVASGNGSDSDTANGGKAVHVMLCTGFPSK